MDKVLVVAEAGVNHNGDLATAMKLIEEAHIAGADAIKFQTAVPDLVMTAATEKAAYQLELTDKGESQLDMARRLHLPLSSYVILKKRCDEIGILFFSSPFDMKSAQLLSQIGMRMWKIPSGEMTNIPLLRWIGQRGNTVALSTGMGSLGEVEAAIHILEESGTPRGNIIVLQCTSEYPTSPDGVNLRAMLTMRDAFKVRVGLSDHTTGLEVAIAAAAMGAELIEKHFTLSREMKGPDHRASVEPPEMALLVRSIRNVCLAKGDGIKKPTEGEVRNTAASRKSIVAAREILLGERFTEENLTTKRPGTGLSPLLWDLVLNRIASRDFQKDEFICL